MSWTSKELTLWSTEVEEEFFRWALEKLPPEKLFYRVEDRFLAYYPKSYKGSKSTLQSRNALVGEFTESWFRNLIEPLATKNNLYVVQSVVCEELGLSKNSPADVAIVARSDNHLEPEDIRIIFEIKMSIVWNWEYKRETGELLVVGDYTTHSGNPSLLRSDTMLKAIGKCLNVRISSVKASKVPLVVVGNTPITKSYVHKVDRLKKMGFIQSFISVNPEPIKGKNTLKSTEGGGFYRVDTYGELENKLKAFLHSEMEFFSGMFDRKRLGKLIEVVSKEKSLESKASKFLELLRRYTDA